MANLINRFNNNINGAITFIGNTLGLSKAAGTLSPGTQGSIGAFITMDNRLRAPSGWGFNTTLDYNLNSSPAILDLPKGSEIIYAELLWAAVSKIGSKAILPSEFVTFIDSLNIPHVISADKNTSINKSFIDGILRTETQSISGEMYIRSRDITDILKKSGNGQYVCSGVNAILEPSNDSMQFAGWSLLIVYKHSKMPFRNIKVWISDYCSLEREQSLEVSFPKAGNLKGRMAFVAAEGDALYNDNNYLKFGDKKVNLSGPNNPSNNFFASQINDDKGYLKKYGPYSNLNHNPYTLGNVPGGRQGWDITNVRINGILMDKSYKLNWGLENEKGVFNENIFVLAIGTQIDLNEPEIIVNKSVDREYASLGDIITYDFKIINNGDYSVENLSLSSKISEDTSFVKGSLIIEDKAIDEIFLEKMNIEKLDSNERISISFKVIIDKIPYNGKIDTRDYLSYEFIPYDNSSKVKRIMFVENTNKKTNGLLSIASNSNMVAYTTVNMVDLSNSKKYVERFFTNSNNELSYTISIINTGNIAASNVVFIETTPNVATFKSGSVYIDGINYPSYNPNPPGFTIATQLNPNITTTITFKVTTTTISSPITVKNSSTISYQYTIDPLVPNGGRGSIETNSIAYRINDYAIVNNAGISYSFTVDPSIPQVVSYNTTTSATTQLNRVLLTSTKLGDKKYANVGDLITYTIPLINNGNISANNVILKDTLPNDTTFVTNSVYINGVVNNGLNPSSGFLVGTVPVGITTVTYKVIVNTLPSSNPLLNSASVTYRYTSDPSVPNGLSGSINTNIFSTQVNTVFVNIIKSVDKVYADKGDTLVYTISVNNKGNTTANNVIFNSTIPDTTTFVSDSFVLNGVTLNGVNPSNNISLLTIPVGISTITFKVIVNTLPSSSYVISSSAITLNYTVDPSIPNAHSLSGNSNILSVRINNAFLSARKISNKRYASIGEEIIYLIPVINSGNVSANNVVIYDTAPYGTTFIPNSLSRDSILQIGLDPSLGANIGTIPVGTTTISFRVLVNSIPFSNPTSTSTLIGYSYTVDPSIPDSASSSTSTNAEATQINSPIVNSEKYVDNIFANVGTTLTYTIKIVNSGNVEASNGLFKDTIPDGTVFLSNSLVLNGVTVQGNNLQNLLSIGTIPIGTTTLSFKVITDTIPTVNPTPNAASITFNYTVDPSLPNGSAGSSNTNVVATKVTNSILNPYKIVDKINGKVTDILNYTVQLYNIGNTTSNEVIFKDTIPFGTSFVENSFILGGETIVNADLNNGVFLGTIPIGLSTINFKLSIDTIPSVNPIPNACIVNYKYTVDPSIPNGVSRAMASDVVNTQVNYIIMSLSKYVNHSYADLGDNLIYTLVVRNTGNINATNLFIQDTIPRGTMFIPNSVIVNNIVRNSINPEVGFNISTIPVGVTTVTFSVRVTTVPNLISNPIGNLARAIYNYSIDPTIPNQYTDILNTEVVNTQINYLTFNSIMSVNKHYVDIGEILTYTILLRNNGNIDANNVVFIDTIPSGTSFILGTLQDTFGTNNLSNLSSGINLSTIPSGTAVTITFQVKVDTIPSVNPIPNSSITTYSYTVDPSIINGSNSYSTSNVVYTKVTTALLNSSKIASKVYSNIGEEIIYTIQIKNTGNTLANNILVIDTIPQGSSYVPNSLVVSSSENAFSNNLSVGYSYIVDPINTITNNDSNISNTVVTNYTVGAASLVNINGALNVTLDAIPVGVTTLTYKVKVNTIPNSNIMLNDAITKYSYTIDPSLPQGESRTIVSNSTSTRVNTVFLNTTKRVDKEYAKVGDTLIYTIEAINTGNTTANDVLFKDTVPVGTSFISNSLMFNGVTQNGISPDSNFNIGTLQVGTSTISFKLLVNTIPSVNPIENSAVITYRYTSNPSIPNEYSSSSNTNVVNTQVNNVFLNSIKYVNKNYANVLDTLVYTIKISNTGNTSANNVIVIDTIPQGVSFITDSLVLNGVTLVSENPGVGVNIGSIGVGVSTLSFMVLVDTVPINNIASNSAVINYSYTVNPNTVNDVSSTINSNIVFTRINTVFLNTIKTVDKQYANVLDTLNYTIEAINTGNTTANNVIIIDTTPVGTSFITNSLKVNGLTKSGATINSGYNLGTLPIGTTTITFSIKVDTIPSINPILSAAGITYSYIVDPSIPSGINSSANTNITTTKINTVFLNSKKYVDKAYANIGDILTYTIPLINSGNVNATNSVFKDTIPVGTSLIENSFFVNDVQQFGINPQNDFYIGDIEVGITTISYKVMIDTIPSINPIQNVALTTYSYTVNPNLPNAYNSFSNTNPVTTKVNGVLLNANKYVNKQFALVGDNLFYSIVISNTGNVSANNVFIYDTLVNGISFISNSLKINSTVVTGANIVLGYTIPTVSVGVTTITFNVLINTIPSFNQILNEANIRYQYTVDPSVPNGVSSSINTNTTLTNIAERVIVCSKYVDKNYGDIIDILNYNIILENNSVVEATSAKLIDTIPKNTTLVKDSIKLNNINLIGVTSLDSLTIGTIPVGATTVSFSVVVDTIPSVNPIPNSCEITYKYTEVQTVPNGASSGMTSNTVFTQINTVFLNSKKNANKKYADIGDVINYTIPLINTGNTTANNAIFTDTIIDSFTFIGDSFKVNGVTLYNVNPSSGIELGTIPVGTTTLSFNVAVNTIPAINPAENKAIITYNYTVNPYNTNALSSFANTNIETTKINTVFLNSYTYVDKAYANIGDKLTYAVSIVNTGNTSANTVVYKVTIPNGVSFITNSLTLNGVTQTGASPVPTTGFVFQSIPVGVTTITFSALIDTIPSIDPIASEGIIDYKYTVDPSIPNSKSMVIRSSVANTKVNTVLLNSKKYVDKAYASIGEILTYTIPLINTGNTFATDVLLIETLPDGLSYFENSVKIEGEPVLSGQSVQNSASLQYSYYGDSSNTNLLSGNVNSNTVSTGVPDISYNNLLGVLNVNVGTIPVGITTISFKVVVDTIPTNNPAVNKGFTSYNYTVDPSIPKEYKSYSDTNSVTTQINAVFLNSAKYVDKAFANVGDTLTYTVPIINTGNISANNLIFKYTVPNGTSFIEGSLKVNSVIQSGVNPYLGFTVGTIPVGTTTISFKVLVNTIPTINPIPNVSELIYNYTVDPNMANAYDSSVATNSVSTQVNTVFLNSIKYVDKTEVDIGDTIVYTVLYYNTGNISANNVLFKDTIPQGTSFVTDSMSVDGINAVGANPNIGYLIGTIPVGLTTVTYSIVVNTIPSINPILNSALTTYSYTVNPSIPNANNSSSNTNTVNTKVNTVILNAKKIVNKRYANIGDILTYTIPLVNTGNVEVNNVLLTDTIPYGLSFIDSSVTLVNSVIGTIVGATIVNGAVNLSVDVIPVGITTLSFKVVVDTIPISNPVMNYAKINYNYTVTSTLPNDKSGVIYTNEAVTEIRTVFLNINKVVDKNYAKVGDNLHYTVSLINTGNVTANNVIIKDTIPQGTSFVTNSLSVDGINAVGANPNLEYLIGTIPVGATTVTYSIVVNTIPSINPILNSAVVTYRYTVDPSLPNFYINSANTNIVSTQINTVFINSTKVVSSVYADIGDVLTYTIPIINTGNIVANNGVFLDTTPEGTIFEVDSLKVNGEVQTGIDPSLGFDLGEILVGVTTISYKVVVETIPTINPIQNMALTTYKYTVDPSIVNEFSGYTNTNVCLTKVNTVFLNSSKFVDKAFANVGDTLTYIVPLVNTGNTTANNANYIDTIQSGTSFINNSFTINGIVKLGVDPATGISLGTLPIGITTLSFKVTINTIPSTNPIQSLGITTYTYTVNPSTPNTLSGFIKTNIVETKVNTVFLNSKMESNKYYANIGDILTYTTSLINTGNVSADNTMFISTIPVGTSFISDSLKVNDTVQYFESPFPGYLVGKVPVGITTISFNLLVETIPSLNPIINSAVVIYDYTVSPTIPNEYQNSSNTNITRTKVNSVLLNSYKFVDKLYANIGDTLIYTITIINTGNTTANNLTFFDTTPNDTTFVENSLTANGVSKPGENPTLGFVLGTVPIGLTTLSFKVVVDTIPSPDPIQSYSLITYRYTVDPSIPNEYSNFANTNIVYTKINTVFLNVTKGVNRGFSNILNNIFYNIYLDNSGNVVANNVTITDTIPNGGNFVENSVMVNGISNTLLNVNDGLVFNEIPVGITTISFKVYIDTIPSPNPMINNVLTNYSYTVDPSIPNEYNVTAYSNDVETQVTAALVSSRKSVDKHFANIGDSLVYSIVLDNNGNTEVDYVVFKDTLPTDTTFVSDSFTVNGNVINSASPSSGVDIGIIPVGTTTISFKVVIDTIPSLNPIVNNASVSYKYTTDPSIPNGSDGGSNSNSITTQVNSVILNALKMADKEYAKIGDTILYTVVLNNTGNISANNVTIKDTIPNGISFVLESTKVNGNTVHLANPTIGFGMGTIPIGITTLTYSVLVETIPTINPVPSESYIKYNYTVNPSYKNRDSSEIRTNKVNTQINDILLNTIKTVNKTFAKEGDTLVYTVSMINTGNIVANNVALIDTIPEGITFVTDSLSINGDIKFGVNLNGGLSLGTIPIGTTTIQFNVLVETIPTINPIANSVLTTYNYTVNPSIQNQYNGVIRSNYAVTKINTVFLNSKKYVNKLYADIGDNLVYTIALFNTGNTSANNTLFIDTIPQGTSFNLGSLKLNGITLTSVSPNSGCLLETVPIGTTTISYSVIVDTIPNMDPIENSAVSTYFFTVNPSLPNAYSNSSNTNVVNTKVNTIFLNVKKVVSQKYANIGDILTYDISLINTGNIEANNVVLFNTIPEGTSFVSNSVMVSSYNNFNTGDNNLLNSNVLNVTMQTIPIGVTTISFKVVVDTIPSYNPIINGARVSYSYTVDPSVPNEKSKISYGNNAITQVNTVFLNSIKRVNKRYADVNDIIIYTIPIYNTGNVEAQDVVIFDTIPVDTSFIDDSLTVNGVPKFGQNPNNGANIGTIPVGTTTIDFKVKVNTIPAINPVLNSSCITYYYTVDPELPKSYNSSVNTNYVDTKINTVFLNSNKKVSKEYIDLKEILTYTISLSNTGNITANNAVLIDTIPDGMTFITNSLTLDDVTQIGANPILGYKIGTIPVGEITITFKISADSIPSPNPMINKAQTTYSYTVDPSLPNIIRNSTITNDAKTNVTAAIVNSYKNLNMNYVDIGDTISYTVLLKNTGNVDVVEAVFIETIPKGISYLNNSFKINGIVNGGVNPSNGVFIGTIPIGTTTINFDVYVETIPSINPVINSTSMSFRYTTDPSLPNASLGGTNSNDTIYKVNTVFLNTTKTVNKKFAKVGETLTYNVNLINTGSVSANNVIFKDSISNGVSYIANSLLVNGVTVTNANPMLGYNLGVIQIGTITVSYKVNVDTIPDTNLVVGSSITSFNYTVNPSVPNGKSFISYTNEVSTKINTIFLNSIKIVNRKYASQLDELTYTVVLFNTGNIIGSNVVVQDTVPQGTFFVQDSLMINGITQYGINPTGGVMVGTIPVGTTTVSFRIKIDGIPSPNPVENYAITKYEYTVDPSIPNEYSEKINSNIVSTMIYYADLRKSYKTVDKPYATCNDIVTYNIVVPNDGNIIAKNLVLVDTIPPGTSYIPNSLKVNGIVIPGDPTKINVGNINPGTKSIVEFKIKINCII